MASQTLDNTYLRIVREIELTADEANQFLESEQKYQTAKKDRIGILKSLTDKFSNSK